jgi:hypothetical protein
MTTSTPDGWIVMRSRVSLAGRVIGADGEIASGGLLSLTAAKDADWQSASPMPHRYDAPIRPDGFYFFLDVPPGDYVLNGEDEGGNEIEQKQVSIPRVDASGPPDIVAVDLSAASKSDAASDAGKPAPTAKAPARPARRRRGSRAR